MTKSEFQCSCCGETHNGPPLAWHFNAPALWASLAPADQQARGELTPDVCIVDGEHFFIRALVEIPVIDGEGPFAFGVWVSLSQSNFDRVIALWTDEGREKEPPYFGWLSNSIPTYPETLSLKTLIHTRSVGLRPIVELGETTHPLSLEQRNGITEARVREIAEIFLHPDR